MDPAPPLSQSLGPFAAVFLLLAAWCWWWLMEHEGHETHPRMGADRQPYTRVRAELARMGVMESAFLERVERARTALAADCLAGSAGRSRAFLSDGVFARLRWQPPLFDERASVRVLELLSARRGARFDELSVLLSGRRGLRGLSAEEVWTFLRAPGARTLDRPGSLEGFCPSCGAPLEIVDAAKCHHCGSWANSGDHDWVLSEITDRQCWRARDYESEIDGWAGLSARDPALTPQALEDRAAAAFWRVLEPQYRERAVLRACDLVLVEDYGGDWTWAHAVAEWTDGLSDRPEPRRDYLTFKRAASRLTDPRQGLRTERCGCCGASRGWRDETHCAYCREKLEDPRRGWALESVKGYGEWKRISAGGGAPTSEDRARRPRETRRKRF